MQFMDAVLLFVCALWAGILGVIIREWLDL